MPLLLSCNHAMAKESQHSKEQRKAHAVQEAGNLSFLLGHHMKRWFGINPTT